MKRILISITLVFGLFLGIRAQNMIVGIADGDSTSIGLDYVRYIVKKGSTSVVHLKNGALSTKTFTTSFTTLKTQNSTMWIHGVVSTATKGFPLGTEILINKKYIVKAMRYGDGTADVALGVDCCGLVIDVVDGL